MSTSCRLQSMQIWRQRIEAYSNKNTAIQSNRDQISFGIQLQTFP